MKKVYGYTTDPKDPRDFLNTSILNITLRLSDKCNFSCKYCNYYDNSKTEFILSILYLLNR